jgi:hypothetical protein
VDPPPADASAAAAPPPSAWELFASPRLRASVTAAAAALRNESDGGIAVIDDALGPRLAAAVSRALRRHASERRDDFVAGALDRTGRSDVSARGDVVCWLAGDEGLDDDDDADEGGDSCSKKVLASPPPEIRPGDVAQLVRSCVSDHLINALPKNALLPSDAYVANAMLSVYAPGAPGFVKHLDNCGAADPRRITAVYYPNPNPNEEGKSARGVDDGGELVAFPSDASRRRSIAPVGDRLVMFYSDEVEHEVRGVREGVDGERLALSFWFLKPTGFDPSAMRSA